MLCSLLPERYQTMDGPLQELLAYWTDSFGEQYKAFQFLYFIFVCFALKIG